MKTILEQLTQALNLSRGQRDRSDCSSTILLLDSAIAASEVAFMLDGQWDGCNAVVVSQTDRVAWETSAALVGAQWCYKGDKIALLSRLNADELVHRYQAGDRNFCNANLRCAILIEQDLREVNLSWAKLKGTELAGANLTEANLTAAELEEASLEKTCLKGANLARSSLKGAKLIGADLRGANLTQANLRGANLNQADLRGANLLQADLRGASLVDSQLDEAS